MRPSHMKASDERVFNFLQRAQLIELATRTYAVSGPLVMHYRHKPGRRGGMMASTSATLKCGNCGGGPGASRRRRRAWTVGQQQDMHEIHLPQATNVSQERGNEQL